MRVFEETFGIDKMLGEVNKLEKKMNVSEIFINKYIFRVNNMTQ
jgi:polyphosphate kinase 2 (PPK2 family)